MNVETESEALAVNDNGNTTINSTNAANSKNIVVQYSIVIVGQMGGQNAQSIRRFTGRQARRRLILIICPWKSPSAAAANDCRHDDRCHHQSVDRHGHHHHHHDWYHHGATTMRTMIMTPFPLLSASTRLRAATITTIHSRQHPRQQQQQHPQQCHGACGWSPPLQLYKDTRIHAKITHSECLEIGWVMIPCFLSGVLFCCSKRTPVKI